MATIDFNYKQQELANHFLNLNENSELYFKILDLDPDTGYPNELGPTYIFSHNFRNARNQGQLWNLILDQFGRDNVRFNNNTFLKSIGNCFVKYSNTDPKIYMGSIFLLMRYELDDNGLVYTKFYLRIRDLQIEDNEIGNPPHRIFYQPGNRFFEVIIEKPDNFPSPLPPIFQLAGFNNKIKYKNIIKKKSRSKKNKSKKNKSKKNKSKINKLIV